MAPDSNTRIGWGPLRSISAGIFEFGLTATKPLPNCWPFVDADQPGVVFGAGVAQRQQLFQHHGDLDAVGRGQRVQLQRVLAHRQLLVMRGAGDGPVDVGELAAAWPCSSTALTERWAQLAPDQPLNWVYQCRTEGPAETRLMAGSVPDKHEVSEDGRLVPGACAQRPKPWPVPGHGRGRRWVRQHMAAHRPGQKVLNLFAYTCAFSVVALQAGAKQVVNVDMSHGAMAIGQQNHQLNGVTAAPGFGPRHLQHLGQDHPRGPYGLIIVDPPSYQKGSFVATKDYARSCAACPICWTTAGMRCCA
jgi:hypothetical protein